MKGTDSAVGWGMTQTRIPYVDLSAYSAAQRDYIAELQEIVAAGRVEGIICPACTQKAKEYDRGITGTMAKVLLRMYQAAGREWTVLKDHITPKTSRDEAMLAYWDLIESQKGSEGPDGEKGIWRVTETGERFLKGFKALPEKATVFNSHVLGFHGSPKFFHECLDVPFDYESIWAPSQLSAASSAAEGTDNGSLELQAS